MPVLSLPVSTVSDDLRQPDPHQPVESRTSDGTPAIEADAAFAIVEAVRGMEAVAAAGWCVAWSILTAGQHRVAIGEYRQKALAHGDGPTLPAAFASALAKLEDHYKAQIKHKQSQ